MRAPLPSGGWNVFGRSNRGEGLKKLEAFLSGGAVFVSAAGGGAAGAWCGAGGRRHGMTEALRRKVDGRYDTVAACLCAARRLPRSTRTRPFNRGLGRP